MKMFVYCSELFFVRDLVKIGSCLVQFHSISEVMYEQMNTIRLCYNIAQSHSTISIRHSGYLHFGQFRCSTTGHFGYAQTEQFIFQFIELFGQLFFVLCTQFGALNFSLKKENCVHNTEETKVSD